MPSILEDMTVQIYHKTVASPVTGRQLSARSLVGAFQKKVRYYVDSIQKAYKEQNTGLSRANPPKRRVGAMGNPQRAKRPHNIPIFGGPYAAQILVVFTNEVRIRMLYFKSFPPTLERVKYAKSSRRYDRSNISENRGPGYRTPTFGEEFGWCLSKNVEILYGQHPKGIQST